MKFKNLLLLVIIFFPVSVFCQSSRHLIYSAIYVIPSDTINTVYFTYKIPYNRFIFVKNINGYKADYRITLEVFTLNGKHVTRQIQRNEIFTKNFENTNSNSIFKQNFIKFQLQEGKYKVYPIFNDLNINKEIYLKPDTVNIRKKNVSDILPPIVVNAGKVDCRKNSFIALTNFSNFIPFSEKEYNLIIPFIDTTVNLINYKIINDGDTLFNQNITNSFIAALKFQKCGKNLILKFGSKQRPTRNFIIENFSHLLKEGKATIYLTDLNNLKIIRKFSVYIKWINKPISLRNPEQAIKYLSIIGKGSTVDRLLSGSSKRYLMHLNEYWKKFDPTPKTEFNPLMEEFYDRIDYAMKHFFTLGGKNGATTDRGKIFIQFGKPIKIERYSNNYGQIVEEWFYNKPKRKFDFIDKDGTGNFKLIKD